MRSFLSALVLGATLAAPMAASAASFDTLSGGVPDIFGHRGTNIFSRENTIEAFRLSSQMGANGFELEPEMTVLLAKARARIYEVPISYSGRDYAEGKKIIWKDGFRAIHWIVRCSFRRLNLHA